MTKIKVKKCDRHKFFKCCQVWRNQDDDGVGLVVLLVKILRI